MNEHGAFVRMPLTLAEPAFLYDLRQGVAIRSLHRISFLSRLNSIIEVALDRTISGKNVLVSATLPFNETFTLTCVYHIFRCWP